MTAALVMVLGYALLNRFAGGGLFWKALGRQYGGPVPGRAIYYAWLAAIPVTAYALHWNWLAGLLCGLSLLIWRLPGWYKAIDAGTNDGTWQRDLAVMSARGLLLFPVLLWDNWGHWIAFAAVTVLVGAGVGLSYHIAWHSPILKALGRDGVRRAELLAGAWIGLAFWVLLQ